jgi:alpha-2-macroglobulin
MLETSVPTSTSFNLEMMIALEKLLADASDELKGSFAYELNDKIKTVELENSNVFRLALNGDDFKKIAFSKVKGSIGMLVTNIVPLDAASFEESDQISIVRSYEIGGIRTNQLNDGDFVKVILEPSFNLRGGVEIVDTLPAGLMALSSVGTHYLPVSQRVSYPVKKEGQRIFFNKYNNEDPIFYYARVVSKGEYEAEPALIRSLTKPTMMNLSPRQSVTIK